MCIGCIIVADAQATFTQQLQQHNSGEGKVTVTQDKHIDDLVNGSISNSTIPTSQKQQSDKRSDTATTQKEKEKEQDDKPVKLTSQDTQTPIAEPDTTDIQKKVMRGYKINGYRVQVFAGGNSRSDRIKAERTGSEIKGYLERSYDKWIQTLKPGGNVLNIVPRSDPRNDQIGWSFVERSYNFDSASGINYTVDVTKPCGARVKISSMADGSAFDPDREYTVAMTSYRAAGGGDLLFKGAGLTREQLAGRTEARYPEIRDLIFKFFQIHGVADPETIANPPAVQDGDRILLGDWKFVPEEAAKKAMSRRQR